MNVFEVQNQWCTNTPIKPKIDAERRFNSKRYKIRDKNDGKI